MKIEIQFNSVVVSEQDMDGLGSIPFIIPSSKSLPLHRKAVKRRRRKGSVKLSTLIDSVIQGIR